MNVLKLKKQVLKEAGLTDVVEYKHKSLIHSDFMHKLDRIGGRKMDQYEINGVYPPDIDADVELTNSEYNELLNESRFLFEASDYTLDITERMLLERVTPSHVVHYTKGCQALVENNLELAELHFHEAVEQTSRSVFPANRTVNIKSLIARSQVLLLSALELEENAEEKLDIAISCLEQANTNTKEIKDKELREVSLQRIQKLKRLVKISKALAQAELGE